MLTPGVETVLVYPEVAGDDGAGTPLRVPSATGVPVPGCWVWPLTAEESATLGQGVTTVYCVVAASFPAGAFAKVAWSGRDWDVLGEPKRFPVTSITSTPLDQVFIRARTPEPL